MKMQRELLYGKFNNDTTTDEGVGIIESMLGGNSAHRAGALKTGLREGLFNSVFLRCPDDDCDFHNNTISYRSLGLRCPGTSHYRNSPYLECASCGDTRHSSDDASCHNCGKRFG